MAIELQPTQELVDRNIAIYESKINQVIKSTDLAKFRIDCVVWALIETAMQRKLADDTKQNLAISATSGLTDIGEDRGVLKKPAESAELTGTVPSEVGVTIPATRSWISSKGIKYVMAASATESGGFITIQVTSSISGIDGNLDVSDELSISSGVSGAGDTLTITVVDTLGADEEDQEVYRQRVLEDQRTIKGGGNSADYRRWSKVVAGVFQTYPYAGLPFGDPGVDTPPDRTVYVQVDESIDPDGIAPAPILDDVEDAIINNPETGGENQPLGINNSTLHVVSIRRNLIFTEIRGLDVDPSDLALITADIIAGLQIFYRVMVPFVDGLDFVLEKNNFISDPILSRLVQNIIDTVGGTFSGLAFGLAPGAFIPAYTLGAGETVKDGGIDFAP